MTLYPAIVQMLGGASLAGAATSLALVVGLMMPVGRAWLRTSLTGYERHVIGWAWTIAFLATAGSLYFSEIVGFIPCPFCWYQRFAMYPLVLVLGVGLVRAYPGIWRFALPLPLIGLVIAAYHVALQFQPTLDLVPCEGGVPCSGRYVAVFGFVSIPVMAGAAFLMISALLLLLWQEREAGPVGGGPGRRARQDRAARRNRGRILLAAPRARCGATPRAPRPPAPEWCPL